MKTRHAPAADECGGAVSPPQPRAGTPPTGAGTATSISPRSLASTASPPYTAPTTTTTGPRQARRRGCGGGVSTGLAGRMW